MFLTCDVSWCGVVLCGVVWCGLVWSGVVWEMVIPADQLKTMEYLSDCLSCVSLYCTHVHVLGMFVLRERRCVCV